MNRIIKFKDNFGEYQDRTPYIIAENDPLSLKFDFSGNIIQPKKLKAVYAVGTSKSRILDVSDGVLQIPYSFFMAALTLADTKEMCLELHEFTETGFEVNVGRLKVEPLSVTKINEGIETFGVIQLLKNQIKTLSNDLTALKSTVGNNNKSVVEQLSRFACSLKTVDDSLLKLSISEKETQESLSKQIKKEKSEKIAALRYLYRHYWNDIRDSDRDLSLKDYCAVIGMDISDLSEEELKSIEEFKTKEGVL